MSRMRTIQVQFLLNLVLSASLKQLHLYGKGFYTVQISPEWPVIGLVSEVLSLINQEPVQEWGEEEEDGAIFGVTLRREPAPPSSDSPDLSPAFGCVQYHTVKLRRLKAATLERLVSHLLDAEHREPDFIRVFLTMYRAFTSTETFIELLFQRWVRWLFTEPRRVLTKIMRARSAAPPTTIWAHCCCLI